MQLSAPYRRIRKGLSLWQTTLAETGRHAQRALDMRRYAYIAAVAALAACAAPLVGWQVHAETARVQFPELEALVHYTTVRRGEVTEHIMTTPEAIEAVKQRQPIPHGTHFVLVDYRNDQVFRHGEGPGLGARL